MRRRRKERSQWTEAALANQGGVLAEVIAVAARTTLAPGVTSPLLAGGVALVAAGFALVGGTVVLVLLT